MVGRAVSPCEFSEAFGVGAPQADGLRGQSDVPRSLSRGVAEMSDLKFAKFDPARVAEFLRRRHPFKTAEAVCAAAGAPADTVRQWLKGAARPGFVHLMALIGAYGPEFLVAVFPKAPRWLDAAHRAERRRELNAEIAAARRRFAALTRPDDDNGMETGDRRGGLVGRRLARTAADRRGEPLDATRGAARRGG